MERTCKKCGKTKPIEEFPKRNAHNKYRHKCIKCEYEYQKQYRKIHAERILIKQKKYYKSHRSKLNKYGKEWRERNQEKVKEFAHEYYAKNKKKSLVYSKKWSESNKDKHRMIANNYFKRQSLSLTDNYIIGVIINRTDIPRNIVTQLPELIEAKREHLKLKRLIKTQ